MSKNKFYTISTICSVMIYLCLLSCENTGTNSENMGTGNAVPISLSDLNLEKKEHSFKIPPNLSHQIFHWQLVNSIFYFNLINLEINAIYKIDFNKDSIELFAKFNLYGKSGTSPMRSFTFSILDPYSRTYHVYDNGKKRIYLMKGENKISFKQIESDANYCTFSKSGNYSYSSGALFYLNAGCHLNANEKEYYRVATNVMRIDTSDLNANATFIHYPEEYSHGIYPINAITSNSFLIKDKYLYYNFSISPFINRYSLENLNNKPIKIRAKSVHLNRYDVLPPQSINEPYSEMIHHYMQGHYSNFIMSDTDPSYFVRIVSFLDKNFYSEEHPTQMHRLQSIAQNKQHSMILMDEKGNAFEIPLDENLNTNPVFIRNNRLFYTIASPDQTDDEILFTSLNLEPVLERLFSTK